MSRKRQAGQQPPAASGRPSAAAAAALPEGPVDPAGIVAARRLAGVRTVPEWLACLAGLQRHCARIDARIALARRSRWIAVAGFLPGWLLVLFYPETGAVGFGIAATAFVVGAVLNLTAPKPLPLKSPVPIATLFAHLAREIAPDVPVRLEADLVPGDEDAKDTGEAPLVVAHRHKGKVLARIETRYFHDPWLSASASPAKGVHLLWQQVDAHRRRCRTNLRGRGKQRVMFTTRSVLKARVAVDRARYEPIRRAPAREEWRLDVREAGKWVKVSVRRSYKEKGTTPRPADSAGIAELIRIACAQVRPIPSPGRPA